jgi:hypothetical protein
MRLLASPTILRGAFQKWWGNGGILHAAAIREIKNSA